MKRFELSAWSAGKWTVLGKAGSLHKAELLAEDLERSLGSPFGQRVPKEHRQHVVIEQVA
jgi:hypothetical protein